MKNILIALDNEKIFNTLKEEYENEIIGQDIISNELTIEYLSKNKVDIIITKDTLIGEMTKEIYIKQIRLIAPNIKIILYVQELNSDYKSFLLANEVFNIIESNKFDINILKENIEENKKQLYVKSMAQNNNIETVNKIENNIVSKQLISIYGTSGSGKSYIASLITRLLYKKTKLKTLLWDMDVENSCADIYNYINKPQNILRQIIEEIDKCTFNAEYLNAMIIKDNDIEYIQNNVSIYDYQEKLSIKYYKKIYNEIMNIYDFLIVDLPATPLLDSNNFFLNNSSKIFFVLNPNYISIRQATKYLDMITNLYSIPNSKISIIINKSSINSLDITEIRNMIGDYNFILEVPYSIEIEKNINGIRDFYISDKLDTNELYKLFGFNNLYNKKEYILRLRKRNNNTLEYVGEKDADKYI